MIIRKNQLFQFASAILLIAGLGACGGGSSDGSDTGGDTNDEPALSLSAKVYDGPLDGATVTVTIDGTEYTATTDASGAFVLEITGEPDPSAMITIVATGGAGQESAELISIAGTFGALLAAAGDDKSLDTTESGAIDVTNLSTAKAVLMIEANGGATPTDDTSLAELEKSIDSDAVLELATIIKLVIDEGTALPDGIASTLELVQDDAAMDEVIATAEAATPGIFDSTLQTILDDPNLTADFVAGNIPGQYFINRAGYFMYANRGYLLAFSEDGTGNLYGNGSSQSASFNWSVTGNGYLAIDIDDADPLQTYLNCNTTSGRVSCLQTITDLEIRLLTDGASTDSVTVYQIGTTTYPFNPELEPKNFNYGLNRLGMEAGALEPLLASDVPGTWSVPLSTPNPEAVGAEYATGLLTFAADGTGIRESDSIAFGWSLNADGVLSAVFAGGEQLDIYNMRAEGDIAIDAMVLLSAGDEIYASPDLISPYDQAFVDQIVEADADGEWAYMDYAGLEYALDTTAGTAYANYYDIGGILTDSYPSGFESAVDSYVVVSWWDIENAMGVTDCTGVTTCFYSYSSTWYPLSEDETTGRIYILEIDRGWEYDATNAAGMNYRGDMYYRHGQNRWLDPVGGAALSKPGMYKATVPTDTKRGDLVRETMGDTIMVH